MGWKEQQYARQLDRALTYTEAKAAQDSLCDVYDAEGMAVTVVNVRRTSEGARVTYVDQAGARHVAPLVNLHPSVSLLMVIDERARQNS